LEVVVYEPYKSAGKSLKAPTTRKKSGRKSGMAEASMAVMNYSLKEFDPLRIQARCRAENRPSARVKRFCSPMPQY
jgi:hypothetical protein